MAQAQKSCLTRLQKEYKSLLKEPVPSITAHPSPANLLEWHFVLEGAKDTDFKGGVYWGKLVFPPNYPFKPPSILILTPNGRFATNTKLCLSFSDFHPESWNPMWSVGTILTGLLSFMYDNQPTTGSISTSKQEKQRLAGDSLPHNVRNPTFRKIFPEWVEEHSKRQAAAAEAAAAAAAAQAAAAQQQQACGDACGAASDGTAGTAAHGGAGGAGGRPPRGNVVLTVAMVIAVLAIAAVPLISSGASLSHLTERMWRR